MPSSATLCLLFLTLLLFLPILFADNVTLSSSLTATDTETNSSWISASGEFAFGFLQLNTTNLFLLAIWYAKIPDRTIVWHPKTVNSVQRGSTVELTASGLILNDPNGQNIWSSGSNNTVSHGAMLDTGNFVLSGTDSVYVWQSFNSPTDTILPTQILGLGDMLYSRLSQNNYSKGRFELHLTTDGNLVLYPVAWPTENPYDSYYRSNTFNPTNSSDSGFQMVFNGSANIYIVKRNGGVVDLSWQSFTPSSANSYYRATLDFDGVFRQYAYPRSSVGNQSWSIVRYIPENICMDLIHQQQGSGACGFNSYCRDNSGIPSCECPIGYSLMDPNNKFGGCKPDFLQGCGEDDASMQPEELYTITEIEGLNWPFGDYDSLSPYNQSQCEQSCLLDCLCAVAIFSGTTCWKKKLPLSNGRLEGGLALIKVRKLALPKGDSSKPGSDKKKENRILRGTLGFSVVFNFVLLVAIPLVLLRQNKKRVVLESTVFETNLHVFSFKELKDATNGFKEELGRGSSGIVYKGVLNSSRNPVAVKKLDKLSQEGDKEFRAEVRAIGKIHHQNLVQLLGYCDEGPNRLLVYEFMTNGSLADFLFGFPRPDWNRRAKVALGIARGLVYLHEECNVPIVHCDIKPHNILLDDHFTARIADFGLAKLLMFDQAWTRTGIRGTRGYVAPEWFKNVRVTAKVDVYSFGVMLLEIICCRRSVEMEIEEQERAILTDWVYDCYMEGNLDALVENEDLAMCGNEMLSRWVKIAIWCIQDEPSTRPTMKMVTQMLEGFVEVPIPPRCTNSFTTQAC